MRFDDWQSIDDELRRLSLSSDEIPGGGLAIAGREALDAFLAHLRSLAPGATWRDVFPDLPAHWDVADPETWTYPYRPIGPFDYPALPAGPVIMTSCALPHEETIAERVVDDARRAGFPIYGAGVVAETGGERPARHMRIVMDHRTTEAELRQFTDWIEARGDLSFDGISRGIDERWAPE